MHCGSKPLKFPKGKNATKLASEAEVADVGEATELGELYPLIEKQVGWRSSDAKEQQTVYGLSTFFVLRCGSAKCVNYLGAIVAQAQIKRAK